VSLRASCMKEAEFAAVNVNLQNKILYTYVKYSKELIKISTDSRQ
jgi:hypothetical protein